MFTDDPIEKLEGYPRLVPGGMWLVHEDSEQHRAWKYWLSTAIGKRFFPEVMQVWHEFPPVTQEGASRVASAISAARDEINDEPKWWKKCKPVPRHPSPWNGFIPLPPNREKLIERDAMREIVERLLPTVSAKKHLRLVASQAPISDALRNRFGIQPPNPQGSSNA